MKFWPTPTLDSARFPEPRLLAAAARNLVALQACLVRIAGYPCVESELLRRHLSIPIAISHIDEGYPAAGAYTPTLEGNTWAPALSARVSSALRACRSLCSLVTTQRLPTCHAVGAPPLVSTLGGGRASAGTMTQEMRTPLAVAVCSILMEQNGADGTTVAKTLKDDQLNVSAHIQVRQGVPGSMGNALCAHDWVVSRGQPAVDMLTAMLLPMSASCFVKLSARGLYGACTCASSRTESPDGVGDAVMPDEMSEASSGCDDGDMSVSKLSIQDDVRYADDWSDTTDVDSVPYLYATYGVGWRNSSSHVAVCWLQE